MISEEVLERTCVLSPWIFMDFDLLKTGKTPRVCRKLRALGPQFIAHNFTPGQFPSALYWKKVGHEKIITEFQKGT